MSNRLGGKQGTAYTGTNANQPPNWTFNNRPPTQFDAQNVSLGDLWMDESASGIDRVWILVGLQGNMSSKGSLAQWEKLGVGDLETLSGNSGGPISPDINQNINVVGDGTTINIVGNPGTNTLTASAVGTGIISTLTGDTGGPVPPTAGNIDILGTTNVITVSGNPATSTLTLNTGGDVATSYITNPATGTAVPAAGVLTFAGAGSVIVSAAGSTVTITGTDSGTVTGLLADDGNTVTPTAGVIAVTGTNGLATTGTVGPNTLTVTLSPIPAFGAYLSSTVNNVTGDGTFYTIIFDTAIFNIGGNYNTGTGTFTAPVDGLYQFSYFISCQNITDQGSADTILLTPTYAYQPSLVSPVGVKRIDDNIYTFSFATLIQLSATQTVNVQIAIGGGSNFKTINIGGQAAPANPVVTYFSGNLVH